MNLKAITNTVTDVLSQRGVAADVVAEASTGLKTGGTNQLTAFVKLDEVAKRVGAGLKWSDPDLAIALSRRVHTEVAAIESGTRAEGVQSRLIGQHNNLKKNFGAVQTGWAEWPAKTNSQAAEVTGVLTGINERANQLAGEIAARQAIIDGANLAAPGIFRARDLAGAVIGARNGSSAVPTHPDVLSAIRELGIQL